MATPTVGTKAVVSQAAGIGQGFGAVPAKTEVTVTDVHDSGTAGTGSVDSKKVIRLEFQEPGLVLNDEGYPEQGSVTRAITVSQEDYDKLFEEAGN